MTHTIRWLSDAGYVWLSGGGILQSTHGGLAERSLSLCLSLFVHFCLATICCLTVFALTKGLPPWVTWSQRSACALSGLSLLFFVFCWNLRLADRFQKEQRVQRSRAFLSYMNLGHFLCALCVCTWREGRSRVSSGKSCICCRERSRRLKCPSCPTVSSASEWEETAGMLAQRLHIDSSTMCCQMLSEAWTALGSNGMISWSKNITVSCYYDYSSAKHWIFWIFNKPVCWVKRYTIMASHYSAHDPNSSIFWMQLIPQMVQWKKIWVVLKLGLFQTSLYLETSNRPWG